MYCRWICCEILNIRFTSLQLWFDTGGVAPPMMGGAREPSELSGLLGERASRDESAPTLFQDFVDYVDSRVSLKRVYRRLQVSCFLTCV